LPDFNHAPLFYPLSEFKAIGLPCRTKAYQLSRLGFLNLVKDPAGRVGITAEEARRYLALSRPLAECKRDLGKATAARRRRNAGQNQGAANG